MKQPILRIGSDARATAIIEFAMLFPVLLFMTTSSVDYGYIQLAKSQLHGATQVAARKVVQSKSATSAERKVIVENTITQAMSRFRSPAGKAISVKISGYSKFGGLNPEPYTDANSNGKWDSGEVYTDTNANGSYDKDMGEVNDLGGVGDVVKIEVTYPLKPMFNYNAALFGNAGSFTMSASAVYRNEPD